MSWHYWSAPVLYGLVLGPLHIAAALKHGLSPLHMIRVNPVLPTGISLGTKDATLPLFEGKKQHLEFTAVRHNWSFEKKTAHVEQFMAERKIHFPVIAKPCRGHVGIGVRKFTAPGELGAFLDTIPVDYIVQEFCDYPFEYGVFFCREPGKKRGKVVSLTEKIIPEVIGDGVSTVRQLVTSEEKFKTNRQALLTHARHLDTVPEKGCVWQVIVQGSHTYGSIFRDKNLLIDEKVHEWVNELCEGVKGFHYGRFDMKVRNAEALMTGNGVKIVEINGCGSDPVHVYDDRHPLSFAAREFFRFFDTAYRIAKINIQSRKIKTSMVAVIRLFLEDTRKKRTALQVIG
jgi:hypothetical protein